MKGGRDRWIDRLIHHEDVEAERKGGGDLELDLLLEISFLLPLFSLTCSTAIFPHSLTAPLTTSSGAPPCPQGRIKSSPVACQEQEPLRKGEKKNKKNATASKALVHYPPLINALATHSWGACLPACLPACRTSHVLPFSL